MWLPRNRIASYKLTKRQLRFGTIHLVTEPKLVEIAVGILYAGHNEMAAIEPIATR